MIVGALPFATERRRVDASAMKRLLVAARPGPAHRRPRPRPGKGTPARAPALPAGPRCGRLPVPPPAGRRCGPALPRRRPIDGIDTPDPLTVVCHCNKVSPDFASTLFTFGILPKHALEGRDLNTDAYNEKPLGTGPFMAREFRHGQYVLTDRNPNYWRRDDRGKALPYLDHLVSKIIPDSNTLLEHASHPTKIGRTRSRRADAVQPSQAARRRTGIANREEPAAVLAAPRFQRQGAPLAAGRRGAPGHRARDQQADPGQGAGRLPDADQVGGGAGVRLLRSGDAGLRLRPRARGPVAGRGRLRARRRRHPRQGWRATGLPLRRAGRPRRRRAGAAGDHGATPGGRHPGHARQQDWRRAVPGQVADPRDPPPGCAFAPRCGLALAACDAAVPVLASVSARHRARCLRWAET